MLMPARDEVEYAQEVDGHKDQEELWSHIPEKTQKLLGDASAEEACVLGRGFAEVHLLVGFLSS